MQYWCFFYSRFPNNAKSPVCWNDRFLSIYCDYSGFVVNLVFRWLSVLRFCFYFLVIWAEPFFNWSISSFLQRLSLNDISEYVYLNFRAVACTQQVAFIFPDFLLSGYHASIRLIPVFDISLIFYSCRSRPAWKPVSRFFLCHGFSYSLLSIRR